MIYIFIANAISTHKMYTRQFPELKGFFKKAAKKTFQLFFISETVEIWPDSVPEFWCCLRETKKKKGAQRFTSQKKKKKEN